MKKKIIIIFLGIILLIIPFVINRMDLEIQRSFIKSLDANQIKMYYSILDRFWDLTIIYCVVVVSLLVFILKKTK